MHVTSRPIHAVTRIASPLPTPPGARATTAVADAHELDGLAVWCSVSAEVASWMPRFTPAVVIMLPPGGWRLGLEPDETLRLRCVSACVRACV